MPKSPRIAVGGVVYHVLNRANGRAQIFREQGDYFAFEKIMGEAMGRTPIRLLSYCLMPNHWHMVLWPFNDGDLSRFLGWLSQTHAVRWHTARKTVGTGHLYQGRFKSFPVQSDAHFLTVARYVVRNPLRANLVSRADDWRWSSLWRHVRGNEVNPPALSEWPVPRPQGWAQLVNQPQNEAELLALRHSVRRGCPYGEPAWVQETADRLGLESTLRPRGRPMSKPRL